MEKEDVIKGFFSKEQLVTPQALEEIVSSGNIPEIKEKFIIDITDLEDDVVKIIKNLTEKPKEADTNMFLKFYTSKFNKMRDIFVSRYQKDFISLNKLDTTRSNITVFGIVKEIKGNSIELEDMTSSVSVIFEDVSLVENIKRDDAIVVEGVSGGKVIYGKKILFADVPIRQAATGTGKACFISNLRLDEAPLLDVEKFFVWFNNETLSYLFISGKIGDIKTLEKMVEKYCVGKKVFVAAAEDDNYPQLPVEINGVVSLSNPSIVEVSGLKILLTEKFNNTMLKKRYLGNSKVILPEDYLILDEVPDIVINGEGMKPLTSNYKAISIVNSGALLEEFKPVIIDFETREVEQISIK